MTQLESSVQVRSLSVADLPALMELVDRDPYTNLFVRYRLNSSRLDSRWLNSQMWGYFEDGELSSACYVGANVVPIDMSDAAVGAVAQRLVRRMGPPGSIVGRASTTAALWTAVADFWGPARSLRLNQPLLVQDRDSDIDPHPGVRRVRIDELDVLYPACVAMFTEEVGVSPETDNRGGYRARVAQLITLGWSFAWIENGEVIFKAEVGAATEHACQLQGVWISPRRRGNDLAAAAMAAVVRQVRETVAPVVTLYVNDYNAPARALYKRVGFRQVDTLGTVLF